MILQCFVTSFNAVQNNTSLKQTAYRRHGQPSFNAVQNNTSLKQRPYRGTLQRRFNAVQNNTSLKLIELNNIVTELF